MNRTASTFQRRPIIKLPACLTAMMLCLGGCRSAAHNDVYIDKLAAEVRFLEDQLYQVDYENKVLREKLLRAKRLEAASKPAPRQSILNPPPSAESRADELRDDDSRAGDAERSLGPIETPRSELGQPRIDPPEMSLPESDETIDLQLPEIIPGDVRPPEDAPLTPPEIDPGAILPPGDARIQRTPAPGQVVLPASMNQLFTEADSGDADADTADPEDRSADQEPGEVESLVIDPLYSRGHDFEVGGASTGVFLVIKGLDAEGRKVRLDAPLQVAIMDPRRDGTDARLGRWDFDRQQVHEAWRTAGATDGVHLPIRWDTKPPLSDIVEVYCRMETSDGRRIMTQATLDLSQHRSREELWTPRAE